MSKLDSPRPRTALGAHASALLFLLLLAPGALAQAQLPATVSGRVTDGERGLPGIQVILFANDAAQRFRTVARAKTDAEGRYLLTNVPPGRHQIMPVAPAYVVEGVGSSYPPGRPLTLVAGEEVKDMDFRVEPGGVITGRVTDADGNPVVGEAVFAATVEETGRPPRYNFDSRDITTDDRGVYRLFGLQPGRYRVSVGRAEETGGVSLDRRRIFRRTFHPDASEVAQARVVEVKSGIEATDVDIAVGRALKTYRVAGQLLTADTGQPVPNVQVTFGAVDPRRRRVSGYGSGVTTNARGEFQTSGFTPGRYVVYVTAQPLEASEFYSDPLFFNLTDADVSGLVVKLKRGATLSGIVVVEGVADRAAAARMLAAVRVYPWVEPRREPAAVIPTPMRPIPIAADGSFRVTGISPGKVRLGATLDTLKGLTLTRVELNGANIIGGFDVAEGAQVAGLRLVLTYGTGTIVGQTSFLNGTPPAGTRMMAQARMVNQPQGGSAARSIEVDARGFFRLEGLPAGEYEVIVHLFGGPARQRRSETLRAVVSDGIETRVAPVIDFQ